MNVPLASNKELTENVNMNQQKEVPGNLGGLGDLLPADVLKKVNELLEQLHRKDKGHQGSTTVINYYAPGSQHVDNQYIFGEKGHPSPETHPAPPCLGREKCTGELPEVLAIPEAMSLWRKAQQAGYVDEHYQPLISRTQAALLADAMAQRLGIKEKWKVFEGLWHRKYMRSDYNLALSQQQSYEFQDELKRLLG